MNTPSPYIETDERTHGYKKNNRATPPGVGKTNRKNLCKVKSSVMHINDCQLAAGIQQSITENGGRPPLAEPGETKSSEEFDGGADVEEQIKGTRHNLTDKASLSLEIPDNSFGHGGATDLGIGVEKKSIVFLDNGKFKKGRQQHAWCKNKANCKQDYTPEAIKGKISKWNCGLTDCSWVWGDKAKLYVKKTEADRTITYKVVEANWEVCMKNNKWPFEIRDATYAEAVEFEEYISAFDVGQNWDNATLIKLYDLVDKNDTTTGPDLCKKYKGLYTGKYKGKIVTIKDEINETTEVIKYDMDENDSQMSTEIFAVYTNSKKKYKILRKEEVNSDDKFNLRFEFTQVSGILTAEEMQDEEVYYGCTPAEMAGSRIYREDRLVSGTFGLKFGATPGMYRNKGGRVRYYFPATDLVDRILGIGTYKQIRENNVDIIKNKCPELYSMFMESYGRTNQMWEDKMKKQKEHGMKEVVKKTTELHKWNLTRLEEEKSFLENRFVGKKPQKFKAHDDILYDGRCGVHKEAKKLLKKIGRAIENKKKSNKKETETMEGETKESTNTSTAAMSDEQMMSNVKISREEKSEEKFEEKEEEKSEEKFEEKEEENKISKKEKRRIIIAAKNQLFETVKIFYLQNVPVKKIQDYVVEYYDSLK